MILLRASLFNLLFYGLTAIACVLCLPGLLLPRDKALYVVYFFVYSVWGLEKYILGLDFEVRGRENLPADGPFIVAAKHQSPYETMKLHILFRDPAIVLKKELLRIPLWGRFLAKVDPVAIDRTQGKAAMAQIIDGARHVQRQNRPLVIFPQGTRVYPWQSAADRPYRIGAARVYEETGMPIVPLALNSGMFWPRQSWIKKPGKVVFEFLPPIMPGGNASDVLAMLEAQIETASAALQDEAAQRFKHVSPALLPPARDSEKNDDKATTA